MPPGYGDFWKEVMTPAEFNYLSQYVVPVLTDARPYGKYSMVDIDEVGGVQVIVRELLDAGLLNGDVLTCTGETLGRAGQAPRHQAGRRQGDLSGRQALQADRRPARAGRQPVAGVLGDPQARGRRGRPGEQPVPRQGARVRRRAGAAGRARQGARTASRTTTWSSCATRDRAARPACRKCSTRRRASPRCAASAASSVALMTDARFSGGSVGLVIGHVGPEAALGGPIALVAGRRRDRRRPEHKRAQLHPARRSGGIQGAQGACGTRSVAANGGIHPELRRCRHAAAASRKTHGRTGDAAAPACIRTARSGCVTRARPRARASRRRTSTGRTRTRRSKTRPPEGALLLPCAAPAEQARLCVCRLAPGGAKPMIPRAAGPAAHSARAFAAL